jgi:hypothetical protein
MEGVSAPEISCHKKGVSGVCKIEGRKPGLWLKEQFYLKEITG